MKHENQLNVRLRFMVAVFGDKTRAGDIPLFYLLGKEN